MYVTIKTTITYQSVNINRGDKNIKLEDILKAVKNQN
jgi:hypothetical protein